MFFGFLEHIPHMARGSCLSVLSQIKYGRRDVVSHSWHYNLKSNLIIGYLCSRNCRWEPEDDSGYDLDHHFEVCNSGHLC